MYFGSYKVILYSPQYIQFKPDVWSFVALFMALWLSGCEMINAVHIYSQRACMGLLNSENANACETEFGQKFDIAH